MELNELDSKKVVLLTSQLIEQVYCTECCKYFRAPATSNCGHSKCHLCWKKSRTCSVCAISVSRQSLKLNLPLQELTENCQVLCESLEKLLNVKLDEFIEFGSDNYPNMNVKEWLEGSQNHFSAPLTNTEMSQDIRHIYDIEPLRSKVQIHTHSKTVNTPTNIVHVAIPQDDWDKIEPMSEKYENIIDKRNLDNVNDKEHSDIDDAEYSSNKPRRSLRRKDLKNNTSPTKEDNKLNKHIPKDSSIETDKISHSRKQNWKNVKKMRKEFCKLSQKNKNKLNISIEMSKKIHNIKPNLKSAVVVNEQVCEIDNNNEKIANPFKHLASAETVIDENRSNKEGNDHLNEVMENQESDVLIANKITTLSETFTNKSVDKGMAGSESENNENMNYSIKEKIFLPGNNQHNLNKADNSALSNKLSFIKKGPLCLETTKNASGDDTRNLYIEPGSSPNNEDIEISIKIGNTRTNIFIKQQKSDDQVKVNIDRGIQTSLGPHILVATNNNFPTQNVNVQNVLTNVIDNQANEVVNKNKYENIANKSATKKNTASADTVTAQRETTESTKTIMSNVMEYDSNSQVNIKNKKQTSQTNLTPKSKVKIVSEEILKFNEADIFGSEPTKENNVKLLKNSEHTTSKILMLTTQTKITTPINADKRGRDIYNDDDDDTLSRKKIKVTEKVNAKNSRTTLHKSIDFEEPINSDMMDQALDDDIDYDVVDIQISQTSKNQPDHINENILTTINEKITDNTNSPSPKNIVISSANKKKAMMSKDTQTNKKTNKTNKEKDSEALFSIVEKDHENIGSNKDIPASMWANIEDFLTPETREPVAAIECSSQTNDNEDDSDKSVVEETPQKVQTLSNVKEKDSTSNENIIRKLSSDKSSTSFEKEKSVISVNESLKSKKNSVTNIITEKGCKTIEHGSKRPSLETPPTINKFVGQIMHKSTPFARKSLNFVKQHENENDQDLTLCPTVESIVKNTQEKEFMNKAFENTPEAVQQSFSMKQDKAACKKLCIAGSCLTLEQLRKLKFLCSERKWTFVDKFVKDITHLVVTVDEEKKCQRSVKYMCALAASKWIVSYEWVEKCLFAKKNVDEAPFEVLDSTGNPGPRRSRIAKRKLFEGITFFCMPPFSVMDIDSLKGVLQDAGGLVVNEAAKVSIKDGSEGPCLLLAEPENTQEDRFIYLAIEHHIVPVNFEWALNCLGTYTLESIQDLLLCPSSLLPKATTKWPACLTVSDYV